MIEALKHSTPFTLERATAPDGTARAGRIFAGEKSGIGHLVRGLRDPVFHPLGLFIFAQSELGHLFIAFIWATEVDQLRAGRGVFRLNASAFARKCIVTMLDSAR